MFQTLRQQLVVAVIKALQRYGPRKVHVLGRSFEVSPDVFNPRFYYTSQFMARNIHVSSEDRVLDMGTGSGIQAICAAQAAPEVTGVDVNPEAVRLARKNVTANNLDSAVSIIEGDLFSSLAPERQFSVILFTPPYLQGTAVSLLDRALFDPGKALLRRFFQDAGAYLREEGYVQMLYSSIAGIEEALSIARCHGWANEPVAREKTVTEEFVIYRFRRENPLPEGAGRQ
jgi:release factor glutamine methyltransferase